MRNNRLPKLKLVSNLLILLVFIIASCNKSNQHANSPQLALLRNSWNLDSTYFIPNYNPDTIINLIVTSGLSSKESWNFMANGVFVISANDTSVIQSEVTSKYSLVNDSTIVITTTVGGNPTSVGTIKYIIKSLTENHLLLRPNEDLYLSAIEQKIYSFTR